MWRDDALLCDILLAAKKLIKFTAGVSQQEFENSDLLQSAVIRELGVIGEAARAMSLEFQSAHAEIPWHEIIGMRNRLIHEYSRVDLVRVWDTVRHDIPGLVSMLEPLQDSESKGLD